MQGFRTSGGARFLAWTFAALSAVAAALPAEAQEGVLAGIDEIVVTGIRDARSSKGATGLNIDIKDTPQSVVQLDREMLDTFALDSVNTALRFANGVSVESVETERTNYFVRGFDIRQMQVDGVLMVTGEDYVGSFDTALFDKIEVIRGANGLLTGIGAPSGTINYIRKRPLNDRKGALKLTTDRWGARRIDADFSTPLTENESWAVRVVGSDSDEDTWIDRYNNHRQVAYAVVDGQVGEAIVGFQIPRPGVARESLTVLQAVLHGDAERALGQHRVPSTLQSELRGAQVGTHDCSHSGIASGVAGAIEDFPDYRSISSSHRHSRHCL